MDYKIEIEVVDGELVCPDCWRDGTLKACVAAYYYDVPLVFSEDGAYLDGKADADTFEAETSDSDIISVSCSACLWSLPLKEVEVVVGD